jgi:hypothetical protein
MGMGRERERRRLGTYGDVHMWLSGGRKGGKRCCDLFLCLFFTFSPQFVLPNRD